MKTGRYRRLFCMLLLLAGLVLCGFKPAEQYAAGDGYIKAATYTSDEWAINFWSAELDQLDAELAQIREDGFNNIVLMIPWRQFQPKLIVGERNETAYAKLDRIMQAAAGQGLGVILRLGYQWDYYEDSNVLSRFYGIFHEPATREAWLDFAAQVYGQMQKHANYTGAFLTWEDFWTFLTQYPSGQSTRQNAQDSGYAAYAMAHYSLQELSALYGHKISSERELYYPAVNTPAKKIQYEFFDVFLNQLLADTQTVFPGLSLEVRLDIDPLPDLSGEMIGISHKSTFGCGSAAYSSSMLAASMGFGGGSRPTAKQAIGVSSDILRDLVQTGGKKTFVDQFLYMDNTPEFAGNAKLPEDQIGAYIRGMSGAFQKYSCGYAVWTYRDYADNVIENPQFGMGTKGWRVSGDVRVEEKNGSNMAYVSGGTKLSQSSLYRSFLSTKPAAVQLYVQPLGEVKLRITAGDRKKEFTVTEPGMLRWEEIGPTSAKPFAIECISGAAYIDDIKYYSHITEGGLYQMNGAAGAYLEDIRALNAGLPD